MRKPLVSLGALLVVGFAAAGQGLSDLEWIERLRRSQLLQQSDSSASTMLNPIRHQHPATWLGRKKQKQGPIGVLPLFFTQQYQSHHPFALNDGSMIPAKGYQVQLRAGLQWKQKHWRVQLAPELVYADNREYEGFPNAHEPITWASYYQVLNRIDRPERFGNNRFLKLFPGQSFVKYDFGNLELGVSTENLWWGPGYRNTLLFTNTASGFPHLTFNTVQPLKTRIGSFEGQLIAGLPANSGYGPPGTNRVYNGQFLYSPKPEQQRYLTALYVGYQPKWLKNLHIGFAKSSYLYLNDASSPLDYLPLQGLFHTLVKTRAEKEGKKASMGSWMLRYAMPKEKAEFYLEYGRGDRSLLPWELFTNRHYRRAYVGGLRKLFALKARDQHLSINVEFTQLQMPTIELIFYGDSWYTHRHVRHGYTNFGEVLGSGIGPGSVSQFLELAWLSGRKKIALEFERLQHNNDYFYSAFAYIRDFRRYYTDLSSHLKISWPAGPFFIQGHVGLRRSLNYNWYVFNQIVNNDYYFKSGYDVMNFEGKLTLTYDFSKFPKRISGKSRKQVKK